ncbi:MAG: S1 RNA-binding domain-containing protein [Exilispira sp.]|jgi:small subunit ribosomal protein S1|nr:S1 RNA-binding domain-containing protein [Exilispira sp.]
MHEKTLDFKKEVENSLRNIKEPRPNKIIKGKIISITPTEVFIDIDWTSEIIIPIEEFKQSPIVGDYVDIYCFLDKENEIQFSKSKADEIKKRDDIFQKYKNSIPVEGKIISVSKDKKTFSVDLDGLKAICYTDNLIKDSHEDPSSLIEKQFKFIIKSINSNRIVLSHKDYLINQTRIERERFFKEQKVGNIVDGIVKKIVEDNKGIEVDLGGFSGFVPVSEISYSKYKPIEETVQIGEKLKLKIIDLDRDQNKIILSLKRIKPNPWFSVSIKKDDVIKGVVRENTDNGIIVEIEEGVTGFIYKKDFSWFESTEEEHKNIKKDSYIEAKVLSVDKKNRKISLGLKQLTIHPWDQYVENHKEKTVVKGKIARVVDFGFFIELDKGVDGLLHKNELDWIKQEEIYKELSEKLGKEIDVLIDSINKDKKQISLSIKKLSDDPWKIVQTNYPVNSIVEVIISEIEEKRMKAVLFEKIDAIIPISEASLDTIYSLKDSFKIGDKVTAKVKKIEPKKGSVLLSIKDYQQQQQENEIKEYKYDSQVSKVTFADLIKK